MTLIQRQDALVAKLEALYRKHFDSGASAFGGHITGPRSRLKRLHCEELIAAGYSKREAWESAEQCNDVAYRNADHAALVRQMGGAA